MPDLVLKQLVAEIDRRTSMLCLHAAGQVQPVDQPYDTLAGLIDRPPFHWHCRSQSVPVVPGAKSALREAANEEILSRTPGQKALLKTGYRKPPGRPTTPEVVPVIERLKNPLPGGQVKVESVPAEQKKDWLIAHSARFEANSNGGGISQTFWVTDRVTGDRFVLKKGQYHAESINEVAATRIADQFGIPGEVRLASPLADGNGWVMAKHAEDLMPGYKVVDTAGSHARIGKMAPRLEDPKDPVRVLLSHFVTDEADAKGGNMLLMSKDGGSTVRLVPIDRSLSQMGWRGAVEPGKTSIVSGDWSLEGRLKVTDLRGYMKTRGSPKGILDLVQQQDARLVRETYDEVLAAAKAIDLDEMFAGLEGAHAEEAKTLIRNRIRLLEERRSVILKQMGVDDAVEAMQVAVGRSATYEVSHVTTKAAEEAIRKNGFRLDLDEQGGRLFGDGVYGAMDKKTTELYASGSVFKAAETTMRLRYDAKNAVEVVLDKATIKDQRLVEKAVVDALGKTKEFEKELDRLLAIEAKQAAQFRSVFDRFVRREIDNDEKNRLLEEYRATQEVLVGGKGKAYDMAFRKTINEAGVDALVLRVGPGVSPTKFLEFGGSQIVMFDARAIEVLD